MSAPPYMRFYWGDYFRDTRRLNRLEHSAYLLILGEMWVHGGTLPADDDTLARAALCTAEEWAEVREAVLPFFKVARGKLTQKRLSEEMSKYGDTVRKRKEAGKIGGSARCGKDNGNTEAKAKANASETASNSRHNQNQNQNHTSEERTSDVAPKRATRLSPDWQPTDLDRAYAAKSGFTGAATDRIAERFRNYWTSKAGKDAAKLDWTATWRNWVITEAERKPPVASAQVDWC